MTNRLGSAWFVSGSLALVGVLPPAGVGAELTAPTAVDTGGGVRFDVPDTLAEVGRTRMIAFHLGSKAERDTPLRASIDGGGEVLTVIREPEVLTGHATGFLRVRGVKPGTAVLRVWMAGEAGEREAASIAVNVVMPRSPFIAQQARPMIDSPLSGSVVWGGFGASVTWLEEPGQRRSDPRLFVTGTARSGERLQRELTPISTSDRTELPTRRASFEIAELPEGDYELIARTNGDGPADGAISEPVRLRAIRASAERVQTIAAADLANWARPERWARGQIRVADDAAANGGKGGKVVVHNGDPPVSWTFTDLPAGWYQVMVRVDGDYGPPTMPSLALYVDGAQNATTATRVPSDRWTRMPVGVPVRLGGRGDAKEPGKGSLVTISPRLENSGERRGVRMDTIELARLDEGSADGVVSRGAREMGGAMDGAAPMMAGGDAMMAGAPIASGGGGSWDPTARQGADMTGEANVPLRVGFGRVHDGATVIGPMEVEAMVSWPGSQRDPNRAPPTSRLLVNGQVAAEQRSAQPRFWVHPGQLVAGRANTIEIVATTAAGHEARSGEVQVNLSALATPRNIAPNARTSVRLSVHEPAWSAAFRERMKPEERSRERRRAGVWSGDDAATVTLPGTLAGRYRVMAEVRAAPGKGPVDVIADLAAGEGGAGESVGKARANTYVDTVALGTIEMQAGQSRVLKLRTDHKGFADLKGEPAVAIDAVVLHPLPAGAPAATGTASIVYPPGSGPHEVFGQDAVVIETYNTTGWARAELLIDGRETGVSADILGQAGPVCLPMILRGVPAGEVSVTVRLTPAGGEALGGAVVIAGPVRVRVLDREPETPGRYERAVRLLDRFGFGPSLTDLARVLTMGEEPWLRSQLCATVREGSASLVAAAQRFPGKRGEGDVAQRVIAEAVLTPEPARARLVLWVENHFNTWVRKVDADRKWSEHVRFESLGAGPLGDLLLASASSPAMVHYLDQTRSVRGRLNENYAREIMELHTVGVKAGYTQADVTALAKVLTGWTAPLQAEGRAINDGETRTWDFRFDATRNDPSPQSVFGLRLKADPEVGPADLLGRYERVREAIEMLACRPETARFVCRKLVESYAVTPAPQAVVDDLASVFMRTHGDLAEVAVALWQHPSMMAMSGQPRLAWPLEYAVRLQRSAVETRGGLSAGLVNGYLKRARAGIFDWPTPDGMPRDDAAYADSNAMLQRWRLARELNGSTVSVVPGPVRYAAGEPDEAWTQRLVDIVAVRVTGRLLGAESNAAALAAMSKVTGTRDERAREAAAVVPTLPEANLR